MSQLARASEEANSSAAASAGDAPVAAPAAAAPSSSASDDAHEDWSSMGFFAESDDEEEAEARPPPRRLLRAEAILARRTARVLLVVEALADEHNHQAVLRTADSFGIQHVWIVKSGVERKQPRARAQAKAKAKAAQLQAHVNSAAEPTDVTDHTGSISMASGRWLTLRYFDSTRECIEALRADNRSIWVTSLNPGARALDRHFPPASVPARLAVVLGREVDGVSPEMCAAADLSVFLPMHGFSESFNVSVAAALTCQRLMDLIEQGAQQQEENGQTAPQQGDLPPEEKRQLRTLWYAQLSASQPGMAVEYMNTWLPRGDEIEAHMRRLQAEEAAAAAAAASSSSSAASVIETGMSALMRPPEISRMPKVQRKVRKRMEAEGQRAVLMPQERREPPAASSAARGTK